MKFGVLSIITAIIGTFLTIKFNIETAELFRTQILELNNKSDITPIIIKTDVTNKIIIITIALIGIFLGVKSIKSKSKLGIVGIVLSIVLLVLSFIPIWQYILQDSTLDINFIN